MRWPKHNYITIEDTLEDSLENGVVEMIDGLASKGKTIHIVINAFGGGIVAFNKIYSAINGAKENGCKIITKVDDFARGLPAVIFLLGDERFIVRSGEIFFTKPSKLTLKIMRDLKIDTQNYERTKAWFFDSCKAKIIGLADKVLDSD